MADPKQIEQELREFFEKEDNIRKADRIGYVMAIINKHHALDNIEHIATKYDLDSVIGMAKADWVNRNVNMEISKRAVTGVEANYVLVLEAFVGYLNRHNLLKKLVKFDHTRRD